MTKAEREIDKLIADYKRRAIILDVIAAIVAIGAVIVWIISYFRK